MKKLLAGLLLLTLGLTPALGQSTKAQLNTEIDTQLPNNTSGAITPLNLRTVTKDIVNSILPTAPVVSNSPAIFDGTTGLLTQGTRSGTTTLFMTGVGPYVNGNCARFDANGNVVDQGSPCGGGGGGGGTPGGGSTTLQYNNAGSFGGITGATSDGTVVTMTSPVLITPTLGAATGTSLALGGCAIGSNTFCVSGTTALTSNSAAALSVGQNGATNPALSVDASTASSVSGLRIKSNAAGSGVALSALSSGTNEPLSLNAKGSGTISLGDTSTGSILAYRPVSLGSTGSIVGQAIFYNATSGSITLAPTLGVLGSSVLTLPATTGTLATTGNVVSSIAGNVGAFTLSTGITNSANDIRLTVPVTAANGGTGVVSPTANTIPINNGASAQTNLALTPAQCVTGNASSVPAAAAGCQVFISSVTANGSSGTITFTNLSSAYKRYYFQFTNLRPGTNDIQPQIQVSTDNGSTWKATTYQQSAVYYDTSASASGNGGSTTSINLTALGGTVGVSSAAGYGWSGTVELVDPGNTTSRKSLMITRGIFMRGGGTVAMFAAAGGGFWNGGNDAVNAVKITASSGVWADGVVALYASN